MNAISTKLNNLFYNVKHPYSEKEGNRYKIMAENASYNVAVNLVGGNFFTGLLIYLNANNLELGIVNIIAYICNMLQILSPLLLSRYEQRKKLLIVTRIVFHIVNIILIGIISNLPIPNRIQIYLILGCIALLNIVSASTAQGFSLWHIESIPENRRAAHFSQNSIFSNLAIYIFVLSGSSMLDRFKSADMELLGMTILRIVAIIFAAIDIFWLAKIKEYPYGETISNVNLKKIFIEPFKHKKYLTSIALIFLWQFVANTCGSYFSVYMLDKLKISYSFINICSAMYVPIAMIMSPIWVRRINRTSWLSVLYKVMFVYGIIHMTHALVMKDMEWFYFVVAVLCHIFSVAINIVISNMSYYNLPRESQSVCLPFCATFLYLGAMCGTGYSILFMSLFENLKIDLFGVTFVTPQIMPVITGVYLILYGIFVFFVHKKEKVEDDSLETV